MRDYKLVIQTDKYHLDVGLEEVSSDMGEYGEAAATAIGKRDYYKRELEKLKAKKEKEFRTNGLPEDIKATEASIKACVEVDEEVDDINTQYLEWKEKAQHLNNTLDSIKAKLTALVELDKLYLNEYYTNFPMKQEGGVIK